MTERLELATARGARRRRSIKIGGSYLKDDGLPMPSADLIARTILDKRQKPSLAAKRTRLEALAMAGDVEVRSVAPVAPDVGRTLTGYAIRTDTETRIGSLFRERITVGAVRGAVDGDIRALMGHDPGRVIGRSAAGTLRLKADVYGLRFELDLPDTPDGETALELVRRGDLTGMSFGFRSISETWDESGDLPLRTIEAMEVDEISVVAWPAYPTTSVALRGLSRHRAVNSNEARRARMRMRLAQAVRGLRGRPGRGTPKTSAASPKDRRGHFL